MTKHIRHTLILALLFAVIPTLAVAAEEIAPVAETMTELAGDVSLTVSGKNVHVLGAQGLELNVYDVTGKCVKTIAIESNDKTIALQLRKGIYIVSVGKETLRVIIR